MRYCIEPGGCVREQYVRGFCRRHYEHHVRRGTLESEGFPPNHGYEELCDRCGCQLQALAADSGRGDRPLLAGTMNMAEAAAYMLGFFDRAGAPGSTADPYIVRRFHELRVGGPT